MNLIVARAVASLSLLFVGSIAFAQSQSNREVLERVWALGQTRACTQEMRARFSLDQLEVLSSQIQSPTDRDALSAVLNPFLLSLGMSHTEFFTASDEDYYFFKSHDALMHPDLPAPPLLVNPGVQLGRDREGHFVREVLDGFPAQLSGVLRGDQIASLDGLPFTGQWGHGPKLAQVGLLRNGLALNVTLELHALNWSEAFQEATRRSVRIIETEGGAIGYVRLWVGTHPQSAALLREIVSRLKPTVQSLILDLRGGYGGAWWEHLDPFYTDSSSYFIAQWIDAGGEMTPESAETHSNPSAFTGPMAVLINEGVRSGKEALTHQFKRTGRARLIGTRTPGYFSAGGYYFTDEPVDYGLYLCATRVTLDGTQIEGVGIAPDEEVSFSAEGPFHDSQLEHAVTYLRSLR